MNENIIKGERREVCKWNFETDCFREIGVDSVYLITIHQNFMKSSLAVTARDELVTDTSEFQYWPKSSTHEIIKKA